MAVVAAVKRQCTQFMQAMLEAERPRQAPREPKMRIRQPAFDWADHVNDLSPEEFRRRCRMSVSSFNLLVTLIKPHLQRLDPDIARRNRLAGAVPAEMATAIMLCYLAGSAIDDLAGPNRGPKAIKASCFAPLSRNRALLCVKPNTKLTIIMDSSTAVAAK